MINGGMADELGMHGLMLDKNKKPKYWYDNKCPKCGNDLIQRDEFLFCETCGTTLKKEEK